MYVADSNRSERDNSKKEWYVWVHGPRGSQFFVERRHSGAYDSRNMWQSLHSTGDPEQNECLEPDISPYLKILALGHSLLTARLHLLKVPTDCKVS